MSRDVSNVLVFSSSTLWLHYYYHYYYLLSHPKRRTSLIMLVPLSVVTEKISCTQILYWWHTSRTTFFNVTASCLLNNSVTANVRRAIFKSSSTNSMLIPKKERMSMHDAASIFKHITFPLISPHIFSRILLCDV